MKIKWGTGTDMTRGVSIGVVIVLACAATTATAADWNFIYKPEKTQSQNIPAPGEGVLTRTITIQKGDTLSKLSHRYSGRSSYFPQILLFNRIKNPDLIYAGAQLQVPVTRQEAPAGAKVEKAHAERKKKHAAHGAAVSHETRHGAALHAYGRGAARLFGRGMSAYEAGRYQRAIEIFDKYLATYPDSPNAAEATLRRAECYEKLAGE
ncbi:MAG TPA: LysM peptidoglycan-binding domain-containing protein [Geobacteraceae bacterium]|nr:LysM peptidoglycan-binding domain-containing protein [Geobacteraceae bacterium]